jgi:NCS1 family nucleobase:cation symporter-1
MEGIFMNYREMAQKIPLEDRPVSKKNVSGLANFFGIYGGEHIAATEFVIGATLVTWGVKATDIFIGLFIGNILATLTYALICAPIGVDTRVTLYSYLKKVMGPYMQKLYNVVWGLASIAMAASMLTVSASAVREIFGIKLQTEWYPTDIKFVLVVIVLGIIVTLVAANGFEAVAKFSAVCVPWMIIVFLAGVCVVIPQLIEITGGTSLHGFGDFMNLMNTSVWNGEAMEGGKHLTVFHVIGFAWMCNLAYHGGLNDMSLFRYAKSSKYGFVTCYGMFVGHFFAWGSAGIMGATAAVLLNQSLLVLDSGAITSAVLGSTGLMAVIVAGWTTANPSIYRASLAYQTIFSNVSSKKLTYFVGAVMTVIACFPITMNIMTIVNIIVLIVPPVGAIVFAEHWIIPKLGGTRYWSSYKGWKINYAGLAAWGISLIFVAVMTITGAIHSYFLFLPTYFLAMISYLALACVMGAKEDYSVQVEEDRKVQEALEQIQDEEDEDVVVLRPKYPGLQKGAAYLSYAVLAVLAVVTIMVLAGHVEVSTWKSISFPMTITYFVLGGSSTYLKYGVTEDDESKRSYEKNMTQCSE